MHTKKRKSRNVKSGVPSMWSINRPGVHMSTSILLVLPLWRKDMNREIADCNPDKRSPLFVRHELSLLV